MPDADPPKSAASSGHTIEQRPTVSGDLHLFYICHGCGGLVPTLPQDDCISCPCGNMTVDWEAQCIWTDGRAPMGLRTVTSD